MEYRSGRGLPTEYGVLGLLLDGPAHGYDLQERLREGLGPVWRVAWSQLYHVLHGLEEKGWAVTATCDSPSGPPRHTYSITPRGRRAFFEWVVAPVGRLRDVRIDLLAKMHFVRRHAPQELDALLARQSDALRRAIADRGTLGGDPWIASVAQSFRRHQTESALAWIHEVRSSLRKKRKD